MLTHISVVRSLDARRHALLMAVSGNFLAIMAMTPISMALPTIAVQLQVDVGAAGWVMTSYLLVLTAMVLVSGRLGDAYGHERVFRAGVVAFAVGSVSVGLAPNLPAIIAGRVVQGLGSALMNGTSPAILTNATPEAERGRAFAVALMAAPIGALAGIALGTVALTLADWRLIFLAAASLALLVLLFTALVQTDTPPQQRARPDLAGAVIWALALTSLMLALSHLHEGDASFAADVAYHVVTQSATVALFVLLVVVERRLRNPLITFSHLRNAVLTTALGANMVMHMTMMGLMFLMPFLIERAWSLDTGYTAGFLFVSQAVNTVATLAGGRLYDRHRSPLLAPAYLTALAAGFLAFGVFSTHLRYWLLFPLIVVMSAASGAFMPTITTTIMGAVSVPVRGFAAGASETSRQLGHTLAVAIIVAVIALPGEATVVSDAGAFLEGFSRACLVLAVISLGGAALVATQARRRRHLGEG
ncbi:MAG: MFS transporter [Chloroflexi bacterium]|nr:MFS transporter [Chloroflexota bacterium]